VSAGGTVGTGLFVLNGRAEELDIPPKFETEDRSEYTVFATKFGTVTVTTPELSVPATKVLGVPIP
jgi:hypothetical protein